VSRINEGSNSCADLCERGAGKISEEHGSTETSGADRRDPVARRVQTGRRCIGHGAHPRQEAAEPDRIDLIPASAGPASEMPLSDHEIPLHPLRILTPQTLTLAQETLKEKVIKGVGNLLNNLPTPLLSFSLPGARLAREAPPGRCTGPTTRLEFDLSHEGIDLSQAQRADARLCNPDPGWPAVADTLTG
jgi:hypothetical protein